MTARERYDQLVRHVVGVSLRELRFRRARNRFGRRVDGAWQIVDFQASSFGSRDAVRFTINLGVALDGMGEAEEVAHRPPPISADMLNTRIGHLLPAGEDHWWDVDDTTDLAALGDELEWVLTEQALAWLDERSDPTRLRELIASGDDELLTTSVEARRVLRDMLGLPEEQYREPRSV